MWYVKKEYVEEIQKVKNFGDLLDSIENMVINGKAIDMSVYYGKTNLYIEYTKKLQKDGYEMVYIDM